MPVFIKIENYEDILDLINLINNKVEVAKNTLNKVHDLKDQEDKKLEEWRQNLLSVEKKVKEIDNILLKPEA